MSQIPYNERTPLLFNDLNDAEGQQSTAAERPATPVCKTASRKPLTKQLIILLVLYGMQPLVLDSVFPFINQMLVEIGVVDDPERVGYYSGIIVSCFSFMTFIAIIPCGYLSDRIGRKPIVLLGTFGAAISTFFFGVSRTYLSMIISHCLGFIGESTNSAMKIMIAELTDKSSQGAAFSWLTISYYTGQVLGNSLGGFLAHPERHLALFRTPFWYQYPYSLPCFAAAFVATVTAVAGYFLLDETSHTKMKRPFRSRQPGVDYHNFPSYTQGKRSLVVLDAVNTRKTAPKSVLSPPIISLLSSTTSMCLLSNMLFILYPLFAFTSIEAGGLGADEATIGTHMAIRSLLAIPIILSYPLIERRVGTIRMYQLVISMFPVVLLFFPALNYLARSNFNTWTMNATLFGCFLIWNWCGLAWTCSFIMVNDAAPSAGSLAMINAISQMSIVLSQAIAPALATSAFSASINSPLLSGNMIWVVLVAFSLLVALHSYTLHEPTADWREVNNGIRVSQRPGQ